MGTQCPLGPIGLGFPSRVAPSPSTHPVHGPRLSNSILRLVRAILSASRRSGAASQTAKPLCFSADLGHRCPGRHEGKGPTLNLPHSASRSSARPPTLLSEGAFCAYSGQREQPNQQQGARHKTGGRGEARAPEAVLAHGPQLRADGNAHVERLRATGGPHSARVTARKKKTRSCARASARTRAPRPPKPQARPSPTRGAEAREPRDVLRTEAAPRSPGPSGSGPPAPARRCVRWACCPRPTDLLHSRPHQSPHPATSPPPLPPLYPPAPLHRPGPRFCRRCSKTDRIFSSQLPGRHLTFNPHGQWEPNTSLARVEASDPARAAAQT